MTLLKLRDAVIHDLRADARRLEGDDAADVEALEAQGSTRGRAPRRGSPPAEAGPLPLGSGFITLSRKEAAALPITPPTVEACTAGRSQPWAMRLILAGEPGTTQTTRWPAVEADARRSLPIATAGVVPSA